MHLTETERCILVLLNRVLAATAEHAPDRKHYERAATIIEQGYHELHDDECLPHLWDTMTRDQMVFVGEVMSMYQRMQSSYADFSDDDKATIEVTHLDFPGFDGNNESAYMIYSKFLVEDLDRFRHLKVRDFNSHRQKIETYRVMLEAMPSVRRVRGELTVTEVRAVLAAESNGS